VTVEGAGVRCELAGVRYEYNVLGTRGPRKMTALIPGADAHGQSYIFRPEAGNDSILDRSALYTHDSQTTLPLVEQRVCVSWHVD